MSEWLLPLKNWETLKQQKLIQEVIRDWFTVLEENKAEQYVRWDSEEEGLIALDFALKDLNQDALFKARSHLICVAIDHELPSPSAIELRKNIWEVTYEDEMKLLFDHQLREGIRRHGDEFIDIYIDENKVYGMYHSDNNSFGVTETFSLEQLGGMETIKKYTTEFPELGLCEC